MALDNPPPIQQPVTQNTGVFDRIWIRWFQNLYNNIEDLNSGGVTSVNSQTGDVSITTTEIPEGLNLYFTDTRVNALKTETTITRVTVNTTITDSFYQWNGNTDTGGITLTLPAGVNGQTFKIANTGTSGNQLTIAPNGLEALLGDNSDFILYDGEALTVTYQTTDGWY